MRGYGRFSHQGGPVGRWWRIRRERTVCMFNIPGSTVPSRQGSCLCDPPLPLHLPPPSMSDAKTAVWAALSPFGQKQEETEKAIVKAE